MGAGAGIAALRRRGAARVGPLGPSGWPVPACRARAASGRLADQSPLHRAEPAAVPDRSAPRMGRRARLSSWPAPAGGEGFSGGDLSPPLVTREVLASFTLLSCHFAPGRGTLMQPSTGAALAGPVCEVFSLPTAHRPSHPISSPRRAKHVHPCPLAPSPSGRRPGPEGTDRVAPPSFRSAQGHVSLTHRPGPAGAIRRSAPVTRLSPPDGRAAAGPSQSPCRPHQASQDGLPMALSPHPRSPR